jgi:hypothetical protein
MSKNKQQQIDKAINNLAKYLVRHDDFELSFDRACDMLLGGIAMGYHMQGNELVDKLEHLGLWQGVHGFIFEHLVTQRNLDQGESLIDDYLKRRGWSESPTGKRYLMALNQMDLGLWEVTQVNALKSVGVVDLESSAPEVLINDTHATIAFVQGRVLVTRLPVLDGKAMISRALLDFSSEQAHHCITRLGEFKLEPGAELSQLLAQQGVAIDADQNHLAYCYARDTRARLLFVMWLLEQLDGYMDVSFDLQASGLSGWLLDDFDDYFDGQLGASNLPLNEGLEAFLQGKEFATKDELQAAISQFSNTQNQTGVVDFQGLSPEKMHSLLNRPYDTPDLVAINHNAVPQHPSLAWYYFNALLEQIGEQGVKPTAKGNLPLNLSVLIHAGAADLRTSRHQYMRQRIKSEEDDDDLHTMRIVMGLAGYLRKYKGRIVLTKKGQKARLDKHQGQAFVQLMVVYFTQFNWAYRDYAEPAPFIQHSVWFAFYLLHQHGQQWQQDSFYSSAFIQAFPMALDEFEGSEHFSQETCAASCFERRVLFDTAVYFGLCDSKSEGEQMIGRTQYLRTTVFFNDLIRWGVGE